MYIPGRIFFMFDTRKVRKSLLWMVGFEPTTQKPIIVRVLNGDTECPLQVCQLSRSSERLTFLAFRDAAFLAPDGF